MNQPPLGFAPQEKQTDLEELLRNFISASKTKLKNQKAFIRNLENQVRQLANQMFEKIQGALPSNTERNPREQVNAVTLRCGRELKRVEKKKKKEKKVENPPKAKKESREVGESKSPKDAPKVKVVPPVQVCKPKVSFPARLVQHNLDKQFSKFLEFLRNCILTFLLQML